MVVVYISFKAEWPIQIIQFISANAKQGKRVKQVTGRVMVELKLIFEQSSDAIQTEFFLCKHTEPQYNRSQFETNVMSSIVRAFFFSRR